MAADDESVILKSVGARGINEKNSALQAKEGDCVHMICRKNQSRVSIPQSEVLNTPPAATRSSERSFSIETDCFLCGTIITEKQKKNKEISVVKDAEVPYQA